MKSGPVPSQPAVVVRPGEARPASSDPPASPAAAQRLTQITLNSSPPAIADHELLHVIGRGAYGEVWLARHTRLGSLRAVKIIRRDNFGDPRPFQREFDGIRRYEPISRGHPNLVAILHLGGTDECFYYVMELADGAVNPKSEIRSSKEIRNPNAEATSPSDAIRISGFGLPSDFGFRHSDLYTPHTLRSELKQHGSLPIDRCLEIAHALASALAHLHANGLVHRDVKPSNVIFVGGVAKLADIGLVAGVDDARSFVGTEGYIPPEGPGTPSADCYSLGKLLYELSTGHDRTAWPEPPADLATRPERERLLELNAILHRACAPDPRQRYAHPHAMLADVELLRNNRSVKGRHAWQRRTKFGMKLGVALATIALLVLTAWLLFSRFNSSTVQPSSAPQPVATIAVLPFDDENPTAAGNEFSEGLTDEIRSGLTRVPALGVVGKSSSAAFKTSPDRLGAARSNKVSAVLTGRVHRLDEKVRLALELTETRSGRLLWTEALEAPTADLFALQIAVMERVPETLGIRLTESQRILLGSRPTQNLEAYRLYWEAKALIQVGNAKAFDTAIRSLARATELDSSFTLAYCELADCYSILAEFGDRPTKALWAPAKAAAQRALDLAPGSSEAHLSMGAVEETFDYDWAGAEAEYRRAVELNPNSAKARWWFGLFLAGAGRSAEARPHRERAMELDPLEAMNPMNLGHQLFYNEGRFEEALTYYQKAYALRPHPEMKRNFGELYAAMGRDADALQAYEEHWLGTGETAESVQALRAAYEAAGWHGYWQKRLTQMDRTPSKYYRWHDRAAMHDRLGNTNQVFECLAKSIENREFYASQIRNPNSWKPYRADPRFKQLLQMLRVDEPGALRLEIRHLTELK